MVSDSLKDFNDLRAIRQAEIEINEVVSRFTMPCRRKGCNQAASRFQLIHLKKVNDRWAISETVTPFKKVFAWCSDHGRF